MTDNIRQQVIEYVKTLSPDEEITVYTLDQFTQGNVDKRKYMGHVLYRLCYEDKLLLFICKRYEHDRYINVFRKRNGPDDKVDTFPMQTLWKGTK